MIFVRLIKFYFRQARITALELTTDPKRNEINKNNSYKKWTHMLSRYANWSIEMKTQYFSCAKLFYQLNSEKGNRLQFIEVEKHQAMAMSVVIQFINCGIWYRYVRYIEA